MSSTRHHSSSTADTKKQMISRNIVSFFLFISIVALSLSICAKVCFVNSDKYAQILTNQKYVNALYDDILQYSYDVCDESSIPRDSVDEIITYTNIYNIDEAYAYGNLTNVPQYTQTTYDDRITQLKSDLIDSTTQMIKDNKLKVDSSRSEGVNSFALKISDYVRSKVEFKYMDKAQTIVNFGKTISVVLIVIFTILSVVLALVTFSIGKKNYRGLRAIAYSFNASAILQFGFVLASLIIKQVKTLVIYPTYLCDSIMSFVNSSILCVTVSACISIGAMLVIATVVWKLKRSEK
jgi:hypothetical protein